MSGDAGKLDIDISSIDVAELGSTIDELIHRNRVVDGRARVTFFDESSSELWQAKLPRGTSVLITTADPHQVPEYFKLTVSSFAINSASPLAGVKSCNYLEKIFAKADARGRGFDECIQINERGEIVSASMANVFWQRDDVLFTPSLKTGCLPGTTRQGILEAARGDCVEVEMVIAELAVADEIFLTSAGLGIVQVAEIDGRMLKRDVHHKLAGVIEHKNTRNRSD